MMTTASEFITPIAGLQYYVPMIDLRGLGMEAVCQPEFTRRQIIAQVADAIGKGDSIIHIKFINGNYCEDVTHEIVEAAINLRAEHSDHDANRLARALFDGDHRADLRKHETV